MTLIRVAVVFVLIYGSYHVSCTSIHSPTNNRENNIISKDEDAHKTPNVETPTDAHAILPKGAENTRNEKNQGESSRQNETPTNKITSRSSHQNHEVIPQKSSHPKKAHDVTLKHEEKKLHHRQTIDELRQRRKEIKEKWQARHSKVSLPTPKGLHNKNEDHVRIVSKNQEARHSLRKLGKEVMNERKSMNSPQHKNIRRHIADVYEPEYKEEVNKHRFTTRTQSLTILPTLQLKKTTEPIQPEVFQLKGVKRSIVSGAPSKSESQDVKHTTESHFNPNYVNFPILPDPQIDRMYYWPNPTGHYMSSSTTPTQKTTEKGKSAEQVGSIDIHPGLENEQVTVKIDTPPFYRNLTHEEKILIQRPLFGLGKSAEPVGSMDSHPSLEEEQVGSIDIHPGLENEQVTVKIDTPPFYRNLTHEEKILIQRPLWGLGKSAEKVEDEVDLQMSNSHYERNSELKTAHQEPSAMLDSKESQINLDDLRETVKDRLRKLRRDSEEKSLLNFSF